MKRLVLIAILAACGGDDATGAEPDARVQVDADTRPNPMGGQAMASDAECVNAPNGKCQVGCTDAQLMKPKGSGACHDAVLSPATPGGMATVDCKSGILTDTMWMGWHGCCVSVEVSSFRYVRQWAYCAE